MVNIDSGGSELEKGTVSAEQQDIGCCKEIASKLIRNTNPFLV